MVSRTFDRLPEVVSRVDVRYGTDSTLITIPSLRHTFAIIQDFVLAAIFLPLLALTNIAGLRGFIHQIVLARAPTRDVILAAAVGGVWTAFSLILSAGIIYAILWRLWGEERSYDRLQICTQAGPLRRTRYFPLGRLLSVRSKLWADHRHFPGDPDAFEQRLIVSWFSWSDTGLILIYEPLRGGKPKRGHFGRELTIHEQSIILVEIDKYRFPEIHWGAGRMSN